MQILLVSTRYSYFIPNLDCKILNIYETPANNSEYIYFFAQKSDCDVSIAVKLRATRFDDISMKMALVLHLPKAIPRSKERAVISCSQKANLLRLSEL